MMTLGPALILITYFGGLAYFLTISLLLLISADEYTHLIGKIGLKPPRWLMLTVVFLPLLGILFANEGFAVGMVVAACVIAGYVIWLYEQGENDVFVHFGLIMAGLFLIGWGGGHLVRLRFLDPSVGSVAWEWTTFSLSTIWMVDTFAYLTGSFLAGRFGLGRHQMFPILSPKKTVEGYVGGVIGGVGIGLLVGVGAFGLSWVYCLAVTLAIGFLTVGGDVLMSMLKREAGVKDSGRIFPGHGGALDRIDTLVWSALFSYYLLYVLDII